MIRLLRAGGVDLNAQDRKGRSLADVALAHGLADFAATLRAHGITSSSSA